MNDKLYDALEVCLRALETGVDIESVLLLYPQFADELRPALEAAIRARELALPAVPQAAIQRGRARVLQHAAGMRKSMAKPRSRWSMFAFPRLASSLAIALVLLLSGTGLVSASSAALPGDNLYPVKRSWEGLRLLFVFSPQEREGLESRFEQERLDEISELLTEGRKEPIAFAGLVTAQDLLSWKVSGITVMITPSSRLPADPVAIGAPVMVIGHTNSQGFVEVDSLEALGPGASLPPFEPSKAEHVEGEEPEDHQGEAEEGKAQQPEQSEQRTHEFQGVVESMNGNLWTINGQQVNVEFAENTSPVSTGDLVEFEGYYASTGQFIVIKIELKSSAFFQGEQLNSNGKDKGGNESTRDRGDSGSEGSGSGEGSENEPEGQSGD
jgi:hypothetical protein